MATARHRDRIKVSVAAVLLLASSQLLAQEAKAAVVKFNIEPQPLAQALNTWADQAGMQVIWPVGDPVAYQNSPAVRGPLEPIAALRVLLEDTGLTYSIISGGQTVAIHGRDGSTGSLPNQATGSLRVAALASAASQTEASAAADNGGVANQEGASSGNRKPDVVELEGVLVTGTFIRGADPLSPVIRADREKIVSEGYSRLDQFVQQLPQNYAGAGASKGSNPIVGSGSAEASLNYGFSSGINLRGLGPSATLVLLNGRRLPPTSEGASVDISRIPLSVIDRVEVLTDGASATYGADAVAGVANIITRKTFDGFEAGARMDSAAEGKTPNFGGHLLAGHSWDSGSVLLTVDHHEDDPLHAKERSYASGLSDDTMLLPDVEGTSAYASLRQDLASDISVTVDSLASRRKYSATYPALGGDFMNRNFGEGDQIAANFALVYSPNTDWSASLVGSYGDQDDEHTIDQGDPVRKELHYRTQTVEAQVEGSLFALQAGTVRGALGVSTRKETYRSEGGLTSADSSRQVDSMYAELLIPLVAETSNVPGVHDLRLSVSGRYDDYDDFGSTTNPKVALQWKPTGDLAVRASYGRSFRAPTLAQLDPNALQIGYVFDFPDPSQPSGTRRSLALDNTGNPDLGPETSRSYTFGVQYQPASLAGLSVELSYFDILFEDKVVELSSHGLLNVLLDADQYGSYLNLAPTVGQVNEALAIPGLLLLDFNDPPGFDPADIRGILSLGYTNAASVQPKGVDAAVQYTWRTGIGAFHTDVAATYLTSYETKFAPTAAPNSGLDRLGEPPRFRGRAQLSWSAASLSAYARVNYTKGYHNQLDQSCGELGCPIDSYTTMDAGVAYTTSESSSELISGLRIGFDISNLFNEDPPYVSILDSHYDVANADPLGRAFAVTVTKKW